MAAKVEIGSPEDIIAKQVASTIAGEHDMGVRIISERQAIIITAALADAGYVIHSHIAPPADKDTGAPDPLAWLRWKAFQFSPDRMYDQCAQHITVLRNGLLKALDFANGAAPPDPATALAAIKRLRDRINDTPDPSGWVNAVLGHLDDAADEIEFLHPKTGQKSPAPTAHGDGEPLVGDRAGDPDHAYGAGTGASEAKGG